MTLAADLDWNLVRLFVEVAEAGSMSKVARRRAITRSSVSQRLAQLERDLQAQLLHRTTRNLRLTEIGRTLYEHGRQISDQFEAACHDVQSLGGSLGGLVRISVPPGIGHSHIQPALIEFAAQHPALSLDVTFSNRIGALIDTEVDVALRIMPRAPDDVVARELCDIHWQLYATPAGLARFGPIETPHDLHRVPFLTTFGVRRVELSLESAEENVVVTLRPRLVSESVAFIREAMLRDMGVAQLSRYVVRDLLATGEVVRVLAGFRCAAYDSKMFILTLPERFPTPAINEVIALLTTTVAAAVGSEAPR